MNILSSLTPLAADSTLFFALDQQRGKLERAGTYSPEGLKALIGAFEPVFGAPGGVEIVRESTGIDDTLRRAGALIAVDEAARGGRYTAVLRLRPDTIYHAALPPLAAWPAGLIERPGWLVSDYLCSGADSCGPTRSCDDFAARGACVDDNFGLFSRDVLPFYMGASDWPTACEEEAKSSHLTARSSCIECQLGCVMRAANVSVAAIDVDGSGPPRFSREIVRESDVPETAPPPAEAMLALDLVSYDATGQLTAFEPGSGAWMWAAGRGGRLRYSS